MRLNKFYFLLHFPHSSHLVLSLSFTLHFLEKPSLKLADIGIDVAWAKPTQNPDDSDANSDDSNAVRENLDAIRDDSNFGCVDLGAVCDALDSGCNDSDAIRSRQFRHR